MPPLAILTEMTQRMNNSGENTDFSYSKQSTSTAVGHALDYIKRVEEIRKSDDEDTELTIENTRCDFPMEKIRIIDKVWGSESSITETEGKQILNFMIQRRGISNELLDLSFAVLRNTNFSENISKLLERNSINIHLHRSFTDFPDTNMFLDYIRNGEKRFYAEGIGFLEKMSPISSNTSKEGIEFHGITTLTTEDSFFIKMLSDGTYELLQLDEETIELGGKQFAILHNGFGTCDLFCKNDNHITELGFTFYYTDEEDNQIYFAFDEAHSIYMRFDGENFFPVEKLDTSRGSIAEGSFHNIDLPLN